MQRTMRAVLVAVASVGWLGCGSADDGGDDASMEEMAAAMGRPQAAEGDAAVAARPVQPRQTSDASLPTRRGFELFDLSNEAAYVLVKADAARVADALAKQLNGTVTKDALGKSPGDEDGGAIVYQLKGHPWSIFALWPDEKFDEYAAELSKELGTDVLTFANSDFSGWSFVDLYRGGEEVEALHWGEDLSEIGAPANPADWHTMTKISTDHGDDIVITDQWLFRSKLRKVTEQELQQGEAFNDALFKLYDAYLPDAEQMPWVGENGIESPLGADAFTAVHLVVMKADE
jgi:hypothetical protein